MAPTFSRFVRSSVPLGHDGVVVFYNPSPKNPKVCSRIVVNNNHHHFPTNNNKDKDSSHQQEEEEILRDPTTMEKKNTLPDGIVEDNLGRARRQVTWILIRNRGQGRQT